jgi:hypothetical protein
MEAGSRADREIVQRKPSWVAAMEAASMMGGANVTYRLADGERLKIQVKHLPLEDPSYEWRVSGVSAFVCT